MTDTPALARDVAEPDRRRQRILAAARQVFEERGLDGASMRVISQHAGCTTGAVYARFSGKEALYAEILAGSLDRLQQSLDRSLQEAGNHRGRVALQGFFRYYLEQPSELALGLYLYQGLGPGGLTPELDQQLNQAVLGIYQTITHALISDGVNEPETQATAGVAQAIGLLIMHRTGRLKLLNADVGRQMEAYLAMALP